MSIFKKKDKEKEPELTFASQPHLKLLKPKERYVFHSDYFMVDNYYATILSYTHHNGAGDKFSDFWGINLIPRGLDIDVSTLSFEQIQRMGDRWISDHQNAAEGVAEMNQNSQTQAGTNTTKQKAASSRADLEIIAQELNNGAAYLNSQRRLMIKAPTLDKLDDAVQKIERNLMDDMASVTAAAFNGEQRQELTNLLARNVRKRGKGWYFTSTEMAGSYNLVTHGLEDAGGEYVGVMDGDVNNAAVLMDVDNYKHHVVVATEQYNAKRGKNRTHVADMWGSKMSQAALIDGHRVVHLVLDGANLDELGPKFDSFTYRIDMNRGDINMFEMFGDTKDELSIFPAHMQKLILMAEQAYETTESDRSVIRGTLEGIATQYYIDQHMWYEDAINNRERLRVVGIPHVQVPKLEMFVSYLDMEYKAMAHTAARDDEKLHAYSILASTFRNLLSNNGDLFNTTTSDTIDGVRTGRRVLYDFSQLMARGKGVAMAQFVNIIGYAVQNLGEGDLVIVHGAEIIAPRVREYVDSQFSRLFDKGGRVAYLYNSMDKFMEDQSFNRFERADYTVLGNMTENQTKTYQKKLGLELPMGLTQLMTDKSNARCYVRRGFDNVVFRQDLQLDMKKLDGKKSRRHTRKGVKR